MIILSGVILLIIDLRNKFVKLYNYIKSAIRKSYKNYSDPYSRQKCLYNLSSSIKKLFRRLLKNITLVLIITILTAFQIVFIHMFKLTFKKTIVEFRSNSTALNYICTNLERKYLSEELIYSVLSLFLVTYLILMYRPKRFSNYIMKKYKDFFMNSKFYGKFIANEMDDIETKSKYYYENMKPCQKNCYNLKDNCCYKIICCPCTCCLNTDSKAHSCLFSCLCKPFRQSKICKFINILKKIFNCFKFCCCCCFCKNDENKQQQQQHQDNDSNFDEILRDLENDKELINSENKLRLKWLVPISPFSSTNCLQSIAVYIAYTYDILNIFMYLYASYLVMPIIPYIRKKEGVLVDFVIQIFQVFLIGFKFYPLLAITDLKVGSLTYFFVFCYVFIILTLKTVNKGLCLRTEVFVKFTLDKINDQLHLSRVRQLHSKLNFTNLLFNTDNEFKYEEMFYKNPSLFDELFGRSDSNDLAFLVNKEIPFDDDTVNELLNNRVLTTTRSTTTTNFLTIDKPAGYRKESKKAFRNETYTYLSDVIDGLNNDDEKGEMKVLIRNLLENLPLYLSLSYLVGTYLLAFTRSIWKKFKKFRKLAEDEDTKVNKDSYEYLIREITTQVNIENSSEFIPKSLTDKYNKFKIKNHNYDYICHIINALSKAQMKFSKKKITNIFTKDRYFRYSKQYINTYTVAFLVIYFFTIFLFRMSNIFGNTVIRAIELMYQFIFSGITQSHIFHNVNLNNELRAASIITTIISIIQLVFSIKAFKKRVMNLNRGDFQAKSLVIDKKKSKLFVNKYSTIASQSLHFPGFLIAHLVYGYIILLCATFILILVFKILYNFPLIWDKTTQLLLPIIVMVLFKLMFIRVIMCGAIECQTKNYRIKNLTAYFTLSYFNFFFDCFLGFMSCINRIWQTALISFLYVSRLDVSIFNENNDLIMKNLDKGHLAYINFAFMEHLYNNQVLNGFCELLIEALFQSVIKLEELKKDSKDGDDIFQENYQEDKFNAQKRLRSIIFLYHVLKTFPSLRAHVKISVDEERYSTRLMTTISRESRLSQRVPQTIELVDGNSASFISLDPNYGLENFSLFAFNEISLLNFLRVRENSICNIEAQLRSLMSYSFDIKEARVENVYSDSDLSECFKEIRTPYDSNCLWSMVSICLIGNSSLNRVLRLMTTCKLLMLKDEFYQIIDQQYIVDKEFSSVDRYKKVNSYYLQILYNSRNIDKFGSHLHLYALSTILKKNIKIYIKNEGLNNQGKQNIEPLEIMPIIEEDGNKRLETLFAFYDVVTNHYNSLIPYKVKFF
jgi:hypothetical protein